MSSYPPCWLLCSLFSPFFCDPCCALALTQMTWEQGDRKIKPGAALKCSVPGRTKDKQTKIKASFQSTKELLSLSKNPSVGAKCSADSNDIYKLCTVWAFGQNKLWFFFVFLWGANVWRHFRRLSQTCGWIWAQWCKVCAFSQARVWLSWTMFSHIRTDSSYNEFRSLFGAWWRTQSVSRCFYFGLRGAGAHPWWLTWHIGCGT